MYYPIDLAYPKAERRSFVDRHLEMERLKFAVEELGRGNRVNLALIGMRRIGKTTLAKEFLLRHRKILPVIVNIQKIMGEPKDFAVSFVLSVLYWAYHRGDESDYMTKTSVLNQNLYNPALYGLLEKFFNELEKSRPDNRAALNYCFLLIRRISEIEKMPVVVFMDEFQDILGLDRFKGVGNVLALFREYLKDENVLYIVAGSAVRMMEGIIDSEDSPVFAQFSKVYVRHLDKNSSKALAYRILGRRDEKIANLLYKYTNGHPEYVHEVATRLKEKSQMLGLEMDAALLQETLVEEVLGTDGKINAICEYVYTTSLERAKYKLPLKSVLRLISKEEGSTQSEIAKKLGKSQGETRNYLTALEDIDLVVSDQNGYFIADPVLSFWIAKKEFGIERLVFSRQIIERYAKQLEEKLLKVSSELGRAKEYELKYKLEKQFGLGLDRHLQDNAEFDLVGKKDGIIYVFEIKWRNRKTDYKVMKKFFEKAKRSGFDGGKLFFVGRDFTESAEKFAIRNGIEILRV